MILPIFCTSRADKMRIRLKIRLPIFSAMQICRMRAVVRLNRFAASLTVNVEFFSDGSMPGKLTGRKATVNGD